MCELRELSFQKYGTKKKYHNKRNVVIDNDKWLRCLIADDRRTTASTHFLFFHANVPTNNGGLRVVLFISEPAADSFVSPTSSAVCPLAVAQFSGFCFRCHMGAVPLVAFVKSKCFVSLHSGNKSKIYCAWSGVLIVVTLDFILMQRFKFSKHLPTFRRSSVPSSSR
jgi:hypothetical protein